MPYVVGEIEVANEVQLAPSTVLYDGSVVADGDLTVVVHGFYYDLAGTKGYYAGAAAQNVTDVAINFIYLDGSAALVINTTGWPAGTHIRLARVFAQGGVIVRVSHERAFFTASTPGGGIVPPTRTLTAGAGLMGGGDLSMDRTFNVAANVDGSITVNANDIQVGVINDIQHGTRGGGTTHAAATTSVAGFMSATDKTKLDGVPSQTPDDTLVFGANGVGTTTTTRYLVFGYTPNLAPTAYTAIRSSRAGTLKNMRVRHNLTGTGGAIVYTLRVNGSDTLLSVSAGAGTIGGADLVNIVSVSADDLLELKVIKASAIALSPTGIQVTLEFNG